MAMQENLDTPGGFFLARLREQAAGIGRQARDNLRRQQTRQRQRTDQQRNARARQRTGGIQAMLQREHDLVARDVRGRGDPAELRQLTALDRERRQAGGSSRSVYHRGQSAPLAMNAFDTSRTQLRFRPDAGLPEMESIRQRDMLFQSRQELLRQAYDSADQRGATDTAAAYREQARRERVAYGVDVADTIARHSPDQDEQQRYAALRDRWRQHLETQSGVRFADLAAPETAEAQQQRMQAAQVAQADAPRVRDPRQEQRTAATPVAQTPTPDAEARAQSELRQVGNRTPAHVQAALGRLQQGQQQSREATAPRRPQRAGANTGGAQMRAYAAIQGTRLAQQQTPDPASLGVRNVDTQPPSREALASMSDADAFVAMAAHPSSAQHLQRDPDRRGVSLAAKAYRDGVEAGHEGDGLKNYVAVQTRGQTAAADQDVAERGLAAAFGENERARARGSIDNVRSHMRQQLKQAHGVDDSGLAELAKQRAITQRQQAHALEQAGADVNLYARDPSPQARGWNQDATTHLFPGQRTAVIQSTNPRDIYTDVADPTGQASRHLMIQDDHKGNVLGGRLRDGQTDRILDQHDAQTQLSNLSHEVGREMGQLRQRGRDVEAMPEYTNQREQVSKWDAAAFASGFDHGVDETRSRQRSEAQTLGQQVGDAMARGYTMREIRDHNSDIPKALAQTNHDMTANAVFNANVQSRQNEAAQSQGHDSSGHERPQFNAVRDPDTRRIYVYGDFAQDPVTRYAFSGISRADPTAPRGMAEDPHGMRLAAGPSASTQIETDVELVGLDPNDRVQNGDEVVMMHDDGTSIGRMASRGIVGAETPANLRPELQDRARQELQHQAYRVGRETVDVAGGEQAEKNSQEWVRPGFEGLRDRLYPTGREQRSELMSNYRAGLIDRHQELGNRLGQRDDHGYQNLQWDGRLRAPRGESDLWAPGDDGQNTAASALPNVEDKVRNTLDDRLASTIEVDRRRRSGETRQAAGASSSSRNAGDTASQDAKASGSGLAAAVDRVKEGGGDTPAHGRGRR